MNFGFTTQFISRRRAYLGVECSATHRRWEGLTHEQDIQAQFIAQRCNLPITLACALARRNLAPQEVISYLDPKLQQYMWNPSAIIDLDKAVNRFILALLNKQKIAIIAGSRLDGTCSLILLKKFLSNWQNNVTIWRPNLEHHKLEFDCTSIANLSNHQDLIICLDYGTLAFDTLTTELESDIIIIDNDVSTGVLPAAHAHVNGNRFDETGKFSNLCTSGLLYLFLVRANCYLRDIGKQEFDIQKHLDLIAIATASERVPLTGINRVYARTGLELVRDRKHPGFRALSDVIPINTTPTVHHLYSEFVQRLKSDCMNNNESLVIGILSGSAKVNYIDVSIPLNDFHLARQEQVNQAKHEAFALASTRVEGHRLVWAANPEWPVTCLEDLASELSAKFKKPAIAIKPAGNVAHSVGVSVPGVNLGLVVALCRIEQLIIAGGGHSMIAEFLIPIDQVKHTLDRMNQLIGLQRVPPQNSNLRVDGLIAPEAITIDLVNEIDMAGPFGIGSPRPRYAAPFQHIKARRKIGNSHMLLTTGAKSGNSLTGFVPMAYETGLGYFLLKCKKRPVHLVGTLKIYERAGKRSPTFSIEDAAFAD